tara:strand:- start:1418 stop:1819 length:402 start_codon:yes stop_codon:yes gene_type:complete
MKSTKKVNWNRISKSFKQYLKEAEEEAPAEEEGEANPFAAAADDKGEEAPADDAEEKEGETAPAAEKPAGIPIKFDINKVKRYNTGKFLSDTGVVKSIDKKGIIVTTQPDQVDVLVNFDDISESVKRFFKSKK